MRHKRIKYNWFHIINELGLVHFFDVYKADKDLKQHINGKKSLSDNRIARAFVLHYRGLLPLDLSWAVIGKERPITDCNEFTTVLKTQWIKEDVH